MNGLPEDPLVEILSRLPAKSLCRCKCVSKAWLRLITDPFHRKRLPQTLAGFFCEDTTSEEEEIHRRFIRPRGRSVSLADPSFSFLTSLPGIANLRLLHSCNGLFLFGHGTDQRHPLGYIVCNPATVRWVAVPGSGWASSSSSPQLEEEEDEFDDDDEEETVSTYLLFDPAISSYFQLVLFVSKGFSREAAVHTYASETGEWIHRTGEQRQQREQGDERRRLGTFGSISTLAGNAFVSGFLHLAVCHIQEQRELMVAVDEEGKTRKVMCWPEKPGLRDSNLVFIGQSQGQLHCVTQRQDNRRFEVLIWVLADYDKDEWVLKHSMSLARPFGFFYSMVAIHPHHNLLYISMHSGRILVSYNMDSKKACAICNFGRVYGCITPYVPYFADSSVLTNYPKMLPVGHSS